MAPGQRQGGDLRARHLLLAIGVFILGFYASAQIAARVIWWAEGIDAGDSDCDQCELTSMLDNIGWFLLPVACYVGLIALLLVRWRRHNR